MVVEGRGMEVMEGKWLVKSLVQSARKGIRMYFCETKVELGKVGVLYEVKRGTPASVSKAV